MDEVEYAVQGHIDNLRYGRKNALLTGQFKKGTTETDLYPLPFDDEQSQRMSGDEITDLYNKYQPYL